MKKIGLEILRKISKKAAIRANGTASEYFIFQPKMPTDLKKWATQHK